MKKTIKNLQMLLAVVGVVAISAAAVAQSVYTEYVDVTPSTTGAGGTITFDIPQFNSSLGTLNSVKLTLPLPLETLVPSSIT